MAKITKKDFKELVDFNFEFLNLLKETNPVKLLKLIKEEMIADCVDIEIIFDNIKTEQIRIEYLINYTSKYSYFIFHYEKYQRYEDCAEIKKCYLALAKTYFKVKDDYLNELIIQSVETYKEIERNEK